jgi:hypothetical protein
MSKETQKSEERRSPMSRQFTALRIMGTIFKILGWLVLILGVLAAIGSLLAGFTLGDQAAIPGVDLGGPLAGIAAFIVALVLAILQFLFFYAAGEAVYLALCIEENTRRSAYLLQQQVIPPEATYESPPAKGYRG